VHALCRSAVHVRRVYVVFRTVEIQLVYIYFHFPVSTYGLLLFELHAHVSTLSYVKVNVVNHVCGVCEPFVAPGVVCT
jgi:hypothetical protein